MQCKPQMQYLDCPFKCGPDCEENIQVHTDCKKKTSTKLNMSFPFTTGLPFRCHFVLHNWPRQSVGITSPTHLHVSIGGKGG